MSQDDDAPVTRAIPDPANTPADSVATRVPTAPKSTHDAEGMGAATQAAGERYQASGGTVPAGLRFRVLRPHARGGLGEVHVAQDVELRREVALKQIQDQHADRQDSRCRFLLEAEITGGLEHPGIVPVYGLGQYADGRPYYAMRFIRGDSLKEAIENFHGATPADPRQPGRDRLELRNLLGRLVDVCQAIAYAHSRGVLHRDLKPGNIMLGKYGETLVVDWGLAKVAPSPTADPTAVAGGADSGSSAGEGSLTLSVEGSQAATQMGAVVGTPQFMSPEQAAGDLAHMGPASDIYSLGATLYVVLTGKMPFADRDLNTLLDKVRRGEFRKPREIDKNIPPALEAICLKAMALKQKDRYDTPLSLAQDIEHWLADEPVSAWKEPWTVRAARWLRRHRTFATAIFTGVCATSIVLAIATVLLTAANERERAAKNEATKQRDIAAANYRLARSAVDRYYTEVSEDVLLKEPGMQELRKNLLGAAQEFYQKFVAARQHDVGVQAELGRAYSRLAQITGEIESEATAITLHNKAVQLFKNDADCQAELARSVHHLGRLYRLTDQVEPSESHYKQAIALWTKLVESDEQQRAELARSQLGLGNLYQVLRKQTLAEQQYRDALAIREKLLADDPKNLALQRDLAVTHNNLAMVLGAGVKQGSETKAEASFKRGRKLQEQLVAARPGVAQYQDDLARTDYNLGDLYARSNRLSDAQASYLAAAERWQNLVRLHPAVLDYQSNLADAYGASANVHRLADAFDKAEADCAQALAILKKLADEHQDVPSYRGELAQGYLQLADVHRAANRPEQAAQDYEQCARIQKELTANYPKTPHYAADLARTYNNLGLLLLNVQRSDDAAAEFEKAEQVWSDLYTRHPEAEEFVVGLAIARTNLGQSHRVAGRTQRAIDACAQAIQVGQPFLAERKSAKLQQALVTAHWKRAEALDTAGQHADAMKDWDAVLQSAGPGERPWFGLYRLMTRARLGEHDAVAAEAEAMAPKAMKNGKASFYLACVFALTAKAADADARFAKRGEVIDARTNRALELLTRAQELNFFRQPENVRLLTDEPALAFLRAREGYRKLLETATGNGP